MDHARINDNLKLPVLRSTEHRPKWRFLRASHIAESIPYLRKLNGGDLPSDLRPWSLFVFANIMIEESDNRQATVAKVKAKSERESLGLLR